ncbi:MAG TPA: pirin family protein [Dongiaceae bacterium]
MTTATKAKTADAVERKVLRLIRGQETSDGAGVSLKRIIGGQALPQLDPFLLFDEFGSDDPSGYIAGFPDHPHRGFETVTYMLHGLMRHRDNKGHEGVIGPGAVQWMTAGSGLIHSEMPEQTEGAMRGFQLWVNLPAKDKMSKPRYQEIPAERFTETKPAPGVTLKVIAGKAGGASGPVTDIAVDPVYLDLRLDGGALHALDLPAEHQAFAYIFDGAATIAGTEVKAGHLALLDRGDRLSVKAGPSGAALVVIAGKPIGEPIARYGPFVMNTREEIEQAFRDYQAGRF